MNGLNYILLMANVVMETRDILYRIEKFDLAPIYALKVVFALMESSDFQGIKQTRCKINVACLMIELY